jgi:MFS family permease
MPIIVLFYYENHLTMREIFIIQAVYSISIVILEIPTGYLADVWGRKNTLIVGAFLGFIGFLIYNVSYSFWGFLLAEVMLGIAQSFISGTDSALLYDTMLALKKEDRYMKVEGQMTSVGNFSEAVAGIIGGLLATVSLRFPFLCQSFVAMLAIPAALTVVEPTLHYQRLKMSFRDILMVFKHSLHVNKPLRNYIFLSSVIGSSTLTMAWFVQPYFKLLLIPVALFGVLWTVLNSIVGFASIASFRIERWMGEKKTILFIILFITLGYIGIGIFKAYWALAFLILFYIVRGVATPVLKDYINKHTASETRATVLSIRNFIIRLIFSGVGPFLGWATDVYTLQTALLLAGFIYFILAIPFFIICFRKKAAPMEL